ncbi:12476_t:CDS:2, partial [Cetraspora pellucida]
NSTFEDREMFCEIHYMETSIVSDGIQKGYPMEINFALLNSCIVQMKDELLNIINRKTKSYYHDFTFRVCNEIGQRKANNSITIIAYPKSQVDYLLEVLVPETALHLISQDRVNIELKNAKKIMKDSSAF